MLKKLMFVLSMFSLAGYGAVALSNVKIKQRYPWNGKVDISFNLASTRSNNAIRVSAIDTSTGKSLNVSTLYDENGNAIVAPIKMSPGTCRIVWDADADVQSGYSTDSLAVTVTAGKFYDYPLYCVVDISGGPTASNYPITYLDAVPEGGWTDEYKTDKIVLRLIYPGVFVQGPNAIGWMADGSYRTVTLTKPFYMAIFEITQGQWKNVMGSYEPVGSTVLPVGDLYPQKVWLNDVRGKNANLSWPTSRVVDSGSFLYNLRIKTNMGGFEVPTEAQWEYACRAGSVDNTIYWKEYPMRFDEIIPTTVGTESPNAWGLYDMLGNIAEWTVDKCATSYGSDPVIDPLGPSHVEGIGSGMEDRLGIIMRCLRGREGDTSGGGFAAHFRSMWYDSPDSSIDELAAGVRVILQLEN
jgi:hypothetical protein